MPLVGPWPAERHKDEPQMLKNNNDESPALESTLSPDAECSPRVPASEIQPSSRGSTTAGTADAERPSSPSLMVSPIPSSPTPTLPAQDAGLDSPITFQKTVVISLDRTPERWKQFLGTWATQHVSSLFPSPERYPAVDGQKLKPPPWWNQGRYAWACMLSHVGVLQDLLMSEDEAWLVFEDDALFCTDFCGLAADFLRRVPDDWDMLYFGGQHLKPGTKTNGIIRATNVNRLHAYAIRRGFAAKAHTFMYNMPEHAAKPRHHVDHRFGRMQALGECRAYTPEEWLVGQRQGYSELLRKNTKKDRWFGNNVMKTKRKRIVLHSDYQGGKWVRPTIEGWCAEKGHEFVLTGPPKAWNGAKTLVDQLRTADLVMIWNGEEITGDWVRRVCDNAKIPWVVVEQGLMPQNKLFHFDRKGIIGRSSLCDVHNLAVPPKNIYDEWRAYKEKWLEGRKWTGGGGYILVPLQLAADTSVYLHSPFRTMGDFVQKVVEDNPGKKIVVSAHPLRPGPNLGKFSSLIDRSGRRTNQLAVECEKVVGINSTVLYECAAMGCPIECLGDCPLAHAHQHTLEDLLATAYAQHFTREGENVDRALAAAGVTAV